MNQLTNFTLYNLWANTKVCNEFLSKLDEKMLDTEIKSSFSTLRKTVYHIWDAEVIWLDRLTGGKTTVLPIHHEPMSLKMFTEQFLAHSKQFSDFVASKNENYFLGELTYKNSQGKEFTSNIGEIIHHVMNHGTYHRGQIVTMLRGLGFTDVASTDYITWCRVRK